MKVKNGRKKNMVTDTKEAIREYVTQWDYYEDELDKEAYVIVRNCFWDVPKRLGGENLRKEFFRHKGYDFVPHFCGCGCMIIVKHGTCVQQSCWACEKGSHNHKPCGGKAQRVKKEWLKEFIKKNGEKKFRVVR